MVGLPHQISSAALSRGKMWQGEVVARRKDGRKYDAVLTVAPVFSVEGNLIGYVTSHQDISQLKFLERVRSRFMTNISHELRTPVTNIKLYLDLMMRKGTPEKKAHYLRTLSEQTNRLERLVQDILEIASLDSGRVAKARKPLSLKTVAETVMSRYESRAEEAGLTLRLEPLPGNIPPVKGDEVWLGRAIGELVENAIIFTPSSGEVTVEIRVVHRDDEPWVTIAVHDTGPGIARDDRKRVFDRFYRGGLAESGNIPGTGLGLSIVSEVLRVHGGNVTLASEVDKGSTFIAWLPAS